MKRLWKLLAVLCLLSLTAKGAPAGMVLVSNGVYHPQFRGANDPREISIKSFYLDVEPVTVGDFLKFVEANPAWRRSCVKPIFADESYLKNWSGDLDPGAAAPMDVPVTSVSWFAAKAYAQWRGKRLPTIAEWEYAASASGTRPDGENDPAFKLQILEWYTTPGSLTVRIGKGPPNYWGARDLHGLVWEWVLDFNSAMVPGDARGLFCGAGAQGAKDAADYPAFMRLGLRSSLQANYCIHNLGFRCAKDL